MVHSSYESRNQSQLIWQILVFPKKRSWPREANCGRVARRSPPTGWDARRKNNRTKRRKARASSTLRSTLQRNSSASAGRGKMMLPVARRATAPSGRGPERRFFTSSREADASWTSPCRGCAMRNAECRVQNGGTCEFGGRRDDKKTGRRAIGPRFREAPGGAILSSRRPVILSSAGRIWGRGWRRRGLRRILQTIYTDT